jgi:hypothetical protein
MHIVAEHLERRLLLAVTPATTRAWESFSRVQGGQNDSDVAVGPEHVVVVSNLGIRFYRKDGTLL